MLAKLGRWHATGLQHRNLSEGGGEKGIEAWKRGSFIDGDAVSFLRDGDKKKKINANHSGGTESSGW